MPQIEIIAIKGNTNDITTIYANPLFVLYFVFIHNDKENKKENANNKINQNEPWGSIFVIKI